MENQSNLVLQLNQQKNLNLNNLRLCSCLKPSYKPKNPVVFIVISKLKRTSYSYNNAYKNSFKAKSIKQTLREFNAIVENQQICDKLLPIIFAKQIEIIKQNYEKYLLICSFCQFFCFYNLERSMDSFCPNCLIRISQRQVWRKK